MTDADHILTVFPSPSVPFWYRDDDADRGSAAGAYVSGVREADRFLAYLDKLHPRTANKL